MDKKIYILPNGGLHGLQCSRCRSVFYANTPADVNALFDKHSCEDAEAEKVLEKFKNQSTQDR